MICNNASSCLMVDQIISPSCTVFSHMYHLHNMFRQEKSLIGHVLQDPFIGEQFSQFRSFHIPHKTTPGVPVSTNQCWSSYAINYRPKFLNSTALQSTDVEAKKAIIQEVQNPSIYLTMTHNWVSLGKLHSLGSICSMGMIILHSLFLRSTTKYY